MGSAVAIAFVFVGVALLLLKSSNPGPGSADSGSGAGGPAPAAGPTNLLTALANAIAQAEGFGIDGAIPTRANNPGDLVLGDLGHGTLGAGITVFATVEDGWNALYRQLNLIFTGTSNVYSTSMTFAQIAERWTKTQVNSWASNVAGVLGVPTSTTLADWMGLNS